MSTKIIAMYLPQYHRIPENDLWWGEGYSDWKAVKDAKPIYEGHNQPRVPIDNNYYDLSDIEPIRHQSELAECYGVYGFGIYHYWFSSHQVLLDKPAHLLKNDSTIRTHYFFMWDNGHWKRTWSNVKFSNSWAPLYEKKSNGPEILAELVYGKEDEWKKHFEYLLPFFEDGRYIKINGKPLFGVFNQNNQPDVLHDMFEYWNQLAIKYGFDGIVTLGKSNVSSIDIADYIFDYEPATHAWVGKNNIQKVIHRIHDIFRHKTGKLKTYDYNTVWKHIIKDFQPNNNYLPGAFVRYDDTPRRGKKSSIITGESPKKFEQYMRELLTLAKNNKKEFLFLTAWNEWGEGAYLEPDEKDRYAYLEALKRAVESVD